MSRVTRGLRPPGGGEGNGGWQPGSWDEQPVPTPGPARMKLLLRMRAGSDTGWVKLEVPDRRCGRCNAPMPVGTRVVRKGERVLWHLSCALSYRELRSRN